LFFSVEAELVVAFPAKVAAHAIEGHRPSTGITIKFAAAISLPYGKNTGKTCFRNAPAAKKWQIKSFGEPCDDD
jgi:hypothetical protein